MLGNYGYSVTGEDENTHAIVLLIHIFISNIFLLNYLIAILSTVYEDMTELGDFQYKSSKYQYIERYQIAMQDLWGYEEMVVHPPPVNYLTSLLWISIFKDNMMLRASQIFSKVIFWLENFCFFITQFLVYETLLIPLIYLRLIYNILRVESNLLNAFVLILLWLIIGPIYLLHGLVQDMYYYFKVLFDYHEDDSAGEEQQKEDELQDKIVIYNELIDTMRAIMNLFKYKKGRRLKKRKTPGQASPSPRKAVHQEFSIRNELKSKGNQMLNVSNKFDLLEELQRQRDDINDEEGYTINKDLILQAWKRFRPVNAEKLQNSPIKGKRRD